MPFKSKAQRRKFAELLVKGEITPETFEEWNRETGSARLPERVKRKTKGAKKKAKPKKRGGKDSPGPSLHSGWITSARRPAPVSG